MGITVNTSPQQITASVGETKIDVTVSGGIGPSGAVGGGYVLPTATASVLGGVKIGSGISIDGSGVISASSGYTLPTATNSVLGGVKIGSGVTITDGVISVSTNYAAASHTHATSDITGLDATLQGIDSALGGKALASDFDQGLKTTDSVSFYQVTVNPQGSGNPGIFYTGAGGSVGGALIYAEANDQFSSINLGSAGQALVVNSGGTLPQWKTLAAADIGAASSSHAHSAADVTSGTFDIARIPTGSTSTTVCIGNDARLSDARTPTAHNHSASEITSGVIATARLASSGTASATTFLRGDQTWATAGSTNASDLTSGTLAAARIGAHASSHQTGGSDAVTNVVVSPSQITGNQNDYSPGTGDIVRLSSDAARNITGITAGSSGDVRVLVNVGSFTITLVHQSTSSAAANRFLVSFGADYLLAANAAAVIMYDGTTSRWRVI